MKYLSLAIFLFSCNTQSLDSKNQNYLQAEAVQLNAPIVEMNSSLFLDSMLVNLFLAHPGASIHYSLNGEEPSTQHPQYLEPFYVTESSTLKARSFHGDFNTSELTELDFVKSFPLSANIETVSFDVEPSTKYQGDGSQSLFDLKKGKFDFTNNAWLGFDTSRLTITVKLKESIDINTIKLSMLRNHGSWIFLPQAVNLHLEDALEKLTLDVPSNSELNLMKYIEIELNRNQISQFSLEIIGLEVIPEWHVGHGTTPWLFIDEIIVD